MPRKFPFPFTIDQVLKLRIYFLSMKKLRISIILLLLGLFSYQSYAQTGYELGVKINSFEQYGAVLKKQLKKENKYFRLDAGNIRASITAENISFGASLGIGFETRRKINDKFNFIFGPTIGVSPFVQYNEISNDLKLQLRGSLGYILGGQYWFNDKFYISLEAIPTLFAQYDFESQRGGAYLNANSAQARLSVFYAL